MRDRCVTALDNLERTYICLTRPRHAPKGALWLLLYTSTTFVAEYINCKLNIEICRRIKLIRKMNCMFVENSRNSSPQAAPADGEYCLTSARRQSRTMNVRSGYQSERKRTPTRIGSASLAPPQLTFLGDCNRIRVWYCLFLIVWKIIG